jgi:hypothetical protein
VLLLVGVAGKAQEKGATPGADVALGLMDGDVGRSGLGPSRSNAAKSKPTGSQHRSMQTPSRVMMKEVHDSLYLTAWTMLLPIRKKTASGQTERRLGR